MWNTLQDFYRSKEWEDFRQVVIAKRLEKDGEVIDEYTGKPILKKYDIILHHKQPLTLDNVNDYNISLNENNIMVVSQNSHNKIHNRFGSYTRHIYLVYGSPLSGKSSYVKSVATKEDLVIDIERIREAITGGKPYERSNRLNDNVFAIRNALYDQVKYKIGKWCHCYIIGTFPYQGERERLAKELGAEIILIDTDKEECLKRLYENAEGREVEEWEKYICDWFQKVNPSQVTSS